MTKISVKTLLLTLAAVNFCFIFNVSSAFAQCGADGKQPCTNSTPKKVVPKATTKKPSTPDLQKSSTKKTSPSIDKSNIQPQPLSCKPIINNDAPNGFVQNIKGIGFEMIGIPSGKYCMGANNGGKDEKPVHFVTINYTFYMGKYEVSQAQWKSLMGNNPSLYRGDSIPVENISWNDAKDFIRKLNSLQNQYEYRLPSESEWEYACRAGTTGDYYGVLDSIAWYDLNFGDEQHPVGGKQANSFGLHDMLGNVTELMEDIYNDKGYNGLPDDGSVYNGVGDQTLRVTRGAAANFPASALRSANRERVSPEERLPTVGFRLVALPR